MENKIVEKIEDGAYFVVDTQYFTNNVVPYDPISATQNIAYSWQPIIQTNQIEVPKFYRNIVIKEKKK